MILEQQVIDKTIILVHGAWHGAWCWEKLKPILEDKGYRVFTPDLPGHGSNTSIPFNTITLQHYTDCICSLIESQNLQNVSILGHSMGGVVVTQVAEKMSSRIKEIIYLSAFIPKNEGSLLDEEQKAKHPTVADEIMVDPDKNEISLKLSKKIAKLFYNKCSEKDIKSAMFNLSKQPFQPFINPVEYTDENFGKIPKIYLECTLDNAIKLTDQQRMWQYLNNCHVKTLESDHSPFLSAPQLLAESIAD